MTLTSHPLHLRGLKVVGEYLKNERELLLILQEMAKKDLFRAWGFSGAYQYVVEMWKLSPDSAILLVNVANLCIKAPVVSQAIQEGKITLSKARRISSPINKGGDAVQWVQTAIAMPQKQLEREVARHNPEVLIQERIKPVYGERSELRCGLTMALEEKLQKVRELASRSLRKPASIEETLEFMVDIVLKKKDPIQKAHRALAREKKKPGNPLGFSQVKLASADAIPAVMKHKASLRDEGECQEMTSTGKCRSRFFTDIHHIVRRCDGGTHDLDNLITLCKYHHQRRHDFEGQKFAKPRVSEEILGFNILLRESAYTSTSLPYMSIHKARYRRACRSVGRSNALG